MIINNALLTIKLKAKSININVVNQHEFQIQEFIFNDIFLQATYPTSPVTTKIIVVSTIRLR